MQSPTWLLLVDVKALVMSMPLERFFSTFFASRGFWNSFRHPSLYSDHNHVGTYLCLAAQLTETLLRAERLRPTGRVQVFTDTTSGH